MIHDNKKRQYSGILVVTSGGCFESTMKQIDALDGVEVHYVYPESQKAVVVQEGETVEQHQAGLRQIQSISGVLMAELAYHYIDDGSQVFAEPNAEATILHKDLN